MKYSENDVVQTKKRVLAKVIGDWREIVIPSHTEGVVVLVHGNPDQPDAYEVEFHVVAQNCHALATLVAGEI